MPFKIPSENVKETPTRRATLAKLVEKYGLGEKAAAIEGFLIDAGAQPTFSLKIRCACAAATAIFRSYEIIPESGFKHRRFYPFAFAVVDEIWAKVAGLKPKYAVQRRTDGTFYKVSPETRGVQSIATARV